MRFSARQAGWRQWSCLSWRAWLPSPRETAALHVKRGQHRERLYWVDSTQSLREHLVPEKSCRSIAALAGWYCAHFPARAAASPKNPSPRVCPIDWWQIARAFRNLRSSIWRSWRVDRAHLHSPCDAVMEGSVALRSDCQGRELTGALGGAKASNARRAVPTSGPKDSAP